MEHAIRKYFIARTHHCAITRAGVCDLDGYTSEECGDTAVYLFSVLVLKGKEFTFIRMKKIFILFCISFFAANLSSAQHQGNNWAISDSILLNFTADSIIVSNSVLHATDFANSFVEPMSTISNDSGQLLFYTSGFTVWNRNHQVMLNGDSLLCNFSVTNGVVIIPFPDSSSLYYIFYINRLLGQGTDGINYSVVDMNLDGGLGGLTMKNVSLIPDITMEKLTAVKHGNGRDWWLITHDADYKFIKFLVTPFGTGDSTSQTFGIIQDLIQGEICFSKSGNKLGLVSAKSVEIYDFNRCTGILSNHIQLDSVSNLNAVGYYGCSFSPDETKFYTSSVWTAQSNLYQYDLNNAIPSSTKILIWHSPTTNYAIGQHELAPDSKIYIANGYGFWPDSSHYASPDMNLSVINKPDSLGLACDFQQWSFYLGGKRTTFGLPNMPNYNLGKFAESPCDTLFGIGINEVIKEKNIVRIYPTPATNQLTVESAKAINTIEIIDAIGRVQSFKFKVQSPATQIDIHALASGIYFIKLYFGEGAMEVKKFVKE